MNPPSVYIVHLWPPATPREPFRASAQGAGSDQATWFTRADALARYFEQAAGAFAEPERTAPAGDPASPGRAIDMNHGRSK